jgi:hypothetical protein
VHAWQHRIAGIYTQTQTLELKCQACGIEVVLRPPTEIRAQRILGLLLMPAIIPGLILWARARKKARAWTDNPVVEGVAPLVGQRPQHPDRRCECSSTAVCVTIVHEGTWSRPIGRRYEYQCARCAKRFEVHDIRGIVFASLFAILLSAVGALLILHPPGAAVGAEQSNRWFGVAMLGFGVLAWLVFAVRVRGRRAHPVV